MPKVTTHEVFDVNSKIWHEKSDFYTCFEFFFIFIFSGTDVSRLVLTGFVSPQNAATSIKHSTEVTL